MTVIANITAFTGTNLAEISVNDPGWVPSTTAPFGSAIIQKSEDFGARVNGTAISKGYLRTEAPGSANQTVRGVVRYATSVTDNFSYFGARISGGNWIGASLSSTPAKVQLVKCINGTRTIVAEPLVTVPINTDHEIEMAVSGQSPSISVSIKFNGVEVVNTTLTESALNPAGSVGLFHRGASAVGNTTGPRFISFYAADDTGADTTAPTLTSPTATATGATTASGSVTTNEANGTLYYLASANATETDVTVKAGSSQAVTATGEQPVTITGLTAATPYYPHYLHRDAAGNDSAVASGAQFTTGAPSGDTDPPTLTGSVTFASITQTTYTAQWPAGSDNVGVTGYEYQIGTGAWTDAGNTLAAAITGRTAGTTETVYVRTYDAAGLRSTPAISGSVTLLTASTDGTITVGSALYPIKYSSASVLNESGLRATVLDATTLAEVINTSGVVCTNGVITITDAALVIGNTYHLAVKTANGWLGVSDGVTAS